ncbi:PAS domain-containing protein [Aneurinibacillus tyrosinisolvens]|uniref:PAS domain-containing protein n=1 Tax=Aneurinibacillus tyrosinisolvens TaxID=1443435 RepID=UPI00063FA21A|nr:PAS domain-containing protein [Aneurinibacillus tyrosinisolvens]
MLDATLDQLDVGVLVIDTNGTIVFVNTLSEKYLGIKREEALHENMGDYFQAKLNHKPDLLTVLSTKKEISRSAVPFGGKYYDVVMKPLIRNGEMIGAIGETTDVTEYVLEQRKLSQAIRDMAANIVPVMSKLGVLPLQPLSGMAYNDEYTVFLEKALTSCLEIKIEYLAVDLTAVVDANEMFIAFLQRLTNCLRLVGVEAVFTGVRPNVASAMADMEEYFADSRFFTQLSQALEYFAVIKE